jgi:hypothetical protein
MVERWHPTLSPGEYLQDLVLLGYSYSLLSQLTVLQRIDTASAVN